MTCEYCYGYRKQSLTLLSSCNIADILSGKIYVLDVIEEDCHCVTDDQEYELEF